MAGGSRSNGVVPVAVVAFAQHATARETRNEPEMLLPVLDDAVGQVGLDKQDVGFTVSGSSDYQSGQPFSFVSALDAVGAWPPIAESHVEMDGAFAFYEAWLRLQHGDIDTALVYAFGKSSPGDVNRTLALQLEPYTAAPLFPDAIGLAGLQARALLETGEVSERDAAEAVARSLRDAQDNPYALRAGDDTADDILEQPVTADPLRDADCPPVTDGCAAIVLAAGDRARELTDTPAWIRGIDHRIEPHHLGVRDLATSASTRTAAANAGVGDAPIDLAEIHAPFTHQEFVVRRALGLNGNGGAGGGTRVNPSGGALVSNPIMVAGLVRIGEAASRLAAGEGSRAVAHATSGPCLQQNLVAVLETE